jgi:hypothetical protein
MCCVFAYPIIFRGCVFWNCAPQRSFTELDLEIPDEFFPQKAEISKLHYIRNDMAADPAIASVRWDNGESTYKIVMLPSVKMAQREYEFWVNNNRFTGSFNGDEYTQIIEYNGFHANEGNIKCGPLFEYSQCFFVARYEEIVVVFGATISKTEITGKDFIEIVNYIDARIIHLLNNE